MATWTFAPSNDGEDHGFHNPGVETFKGNLEQYLAREAIQNSIDARKDKRKPVQVSFDIVTLNRDDIPGMDDLSETMTRCGAYFSHEKKPKEFFDRARDLAKKRIVECLRIRDENTTGVEGTDEDRKGGWYYLVRCSGASGKGGGEGGSFGLGKHAPFAASRLLTVFYSTVTSTGYAFQGVARLVTHEVKRIRKQPTGYLGTPTGRSIRKKGEIPAQFRRSELGTDVFVLGYHADKNWRDEFVYSVLDNFWPAIHWGDLVVTVDKQKVNAKNLPQLLEAYSSRNKGFDAHLYYRAYTEKATLDRKHALPNLGEVRARFITGDQSLPNRTAMIRATGMVISREEGEAEFRIAACSNAGIRMETKNSGRWSRRDTMHGTRIFPKKARIVPSRRNSTSFSSNASKTSHHRVPRRQSSYRI